jgi:hypothetical protein
MFPFLLKRQHLVVMVLLALAVALPARAQVATRKTAATVWISRDVPSGTQKDPRTETERRFAPYGFMPAERTSQISVNASESVDKNDPERGTCVSYAFQFKDTDDWMGVFTLIGGNAWGSKPGYNMQQMLGLGPRDVAVLRFRARGSEGGEVVSFQAGAVTTGKYRSSIPFPRKTPKDPVELTKAWTDFEISLRASDLTNVVDPFCVLAKASDNPGKESIEIMVDDLRLESRR